MGIFAFIKTFAVVAYDHHQSLLLKPTDKIVPVKISYKQDGSMVYFWGFDGDYNKIYPYFGVLAPDGKTMLVDARAIDQSKFGYGSPRLPNYVNTNAWLLLFVYNRCNTNRTVWGETWGDEGYCWIKYNSNNIGCYAIWAIASKDGSRTVPMFTTPVKVTKPVPLNVDKNIVEKKRNIL